MIPRHYRQLPWGQWACEKTQSSPTRPRPVGRSIKDKSACRTEGTWARGETSAKSPHIPARPARATRRRSDGARFLACSRHRSPAPVRFMPTHLDAPHRTATAVPRSQVERPAPELVARVRPGAALAAIRALEDRADRRGTPAQETAAAAVRARAGAARAPMRVEVSAARGPRVMTEVFPMPAREDPRGEPTRDRREVPMAQRAETPMGVSPAEPPMRTTPVMRARTTLAMRPTATSTNVLRKATPPFASASGRTAGRSTPSTIAALRSASTAAPARRR